MYQRKLHDIQEKPPHISLLSWYIQHIHNLFSLAYLGRNSSYTGGAISDTAVFHKNKESLAYVQSYLKSLDNISLEFGNFTCYVQDI